MKLFKIICLLILLTSCTKKICTDPVACKKVEYNLSIIKNYVDNRPRTGNRTEAVFFLTELTGISSDSPGSDIGQPYPTFGDYAKWSQWYENHKDKLYWDKKKQKIIVKK